MEPRPRILSQPVGQMATHEVIWAAIRRIDHDRQPITVFDVVKLCGCSDRNAQSYMQKLVRAGIIETVTPVVKPGDRPDYRLRLNVGVDAPRFDKHGQLKTTRLPRERIWAAIRVLAAGFGLPELCAIADVAEATARQYLAVLRNGGFLQVTRDKAAYSGKGGPRLLYWMPPNKNTGPKPPEFRNGEIWDLNEDRKVYPKDSQP